MTIFLHLMTNRHAIGRWAELIVLFVAMPLLYLTSAGRTPVIPIPLAVTAYCMIVLWRDPTFDRSLL